LVGCHSPWRFPPPPRANHEISQSSKNRQTNLWPVYWDHLFLLFRLFHLLHLISGIKEYKVAEDIMATTVLDPISLPAAEEAQVQALHDLLRKDGKARLVGRGGEPALELPDAVYELLLKIVGGLQQGKAISVVPVTQDLTTQEAAELLGVSRPFFVKLLKEDELPFHLIGTHRRVYLKDLLDYKHRRDHQRREALDTMAREADEAGLYDKVLLPDA
jgi:excisionase family DNA binding protein